MQHATVRTGSRQENSTPYSSILPAGNLREEEGWRIQQALCFQQAICATQAGRQDRSWHATRGCTPCHRSPSAGGRGGAARWRPRLVRCSFSSSAPMSSSSCVLSKHGGSRLPHERRQLTNPHWLGGLLQPPVRATQTCTSLQPPTAHLDGASHALLQRRLHRFAQKLSNADDLARLLQQLDLQGPHSNESSGAHGWMHGTTASTTDQ